MFVDRRQDRVPHGLYGFGHLHEGFIDLMFYQIADDTPKVLGVIFRRFIKVREIVPRRIRVRQQPDCRCCYLSCMVALFFNDLEPIDGNVLFFRCDRFPSRITTPPSSAINSAPAFSRVLPARCQIGGINTVRRICWSDVAFAPAFIGVVIGRARQQCAFPWRIANGTQGKGYVEC